MIERVDDKISECPQLKIIRIDGSLFFGAVNHVSEYLENIDNENPKHLLIVGAGISYIDISGAMMLVQEARRRRGLKKNLYLCGLNHEILDFLKTGDYLHEIHEKNIFDSKQNAISHIISKLDTDICQTCLLKIFEECPEPAGQQKYF